GGHRPAPAHRSAVDRIDDRGGPVGVVGTGARYCDARPARDEAVSLLVRAARRLELRPGKQPIYTKTTDKRILKLLDKLPPDGFARWTGPLLAEALGDVDVQYVWRFLRSHKIDLAARKSWCESTDPNFTAKAADVVGLYVAPPAKAIVLCVDEKPSIQALERAQGYLKLPNGRALTGQSHDYKRHGTTTLFAALEVATG